MFTTERRTFLSYIPEWLRNPLGMLALILLLVNALFTAWLGFGWFPQLDSLVFANVIYDFMSLAALAFGLLVAFHPGQNRRLRRAWLVISLAYGFGLIGDVLFTYLELVPYANSVVPYPSIADIFYLGTYILSVGGIFLLPGETVPPKKHLQFGFDLLILALVSWIFFWQLIIYPSIQSSEQGALALFLAVIYPLADLFFLLGLLYLIRRKTILIHPSALLFLLVAFLFTTLTDIVSAIFSLAGTYQSGTILDTGWTWDFCFFSLASLRQFSHKQGSDFGAMPGQKVLTFLSENIQIILAPLGLIMAAYGLLYGQYPDLPAASLVAPALMIAIATIGRLALTNQESLRYSRQLDQTLNELDQSYHQISQAVEDRTRDLHLAVNVGQTIFRERNLEDLLQRAVDLIQGSFGLYYAQIYLAEKGGLKLRAGSGEAGRKLAGRGHSLLIGLGSINGTAALERRPVVVEDTQASPIFRPNTLLPETRSELSVPLVVADRLLGVLDMQSAKKGALSEEILPVAEVLASQLALAIENANLAARTQQAQTELEQRLRRQAHQGWREFLDGIQQPERLGYILEQGPPLENRPHEEPLLQPIQGVNSASFFAANTQSISDVVAGVETLAVPIEVSGEPVGAIRLQRLATPGSQPDAQPPPEALGYGWSADEIELINLVSARIARQVENLRLLAQAELFRKQAEEVVQQQVHDAWAEVLQPDKSEHAVKTVESEKRLPRGVLYAQDQVTTLGDDRLISSLHLPHFQVSHSEPLQILGQKIGELVVGEGEALTTDQLALVKEIAGRLSAHLETLRLSAQTERALASTEALYSGSERIIRAQTMQEVLQSLVSATALEQYEHASIVVFDHPLDSIPTESGSLERAAFAGRTASVAAVWQRFASFRTAPPDRGISFQDIPFVQFLQRDQPFIVADVSSDVRLEAETRRLMQEMGNSVAIFPLVAGDQWIGWLAAVASTTVRLAESQVRQAQSLVGQAAAVVQALRLVQQSEARAQRESLLRQVAERVRAAVEPELVLRTAAREVGVALGRNVLVRLYPPAQNDDESPKE